MALSKTWYTSGNRALDDTSTGLRLSASMLFALKGFLTGAITGTAGTGGQPPSSAFWTVDSSSDSVTASAADNLGAGTFTASKWVRAAAGTAHTWYVLKSPTVGPLDGPWYMLVSMAGTADANAAFAVSKNAFTGGSVTADPTSTNQSTFTTVAFNDATAAAGKAHYICDAKGNFWFLTSRNGTGFFQFCATFQEMVESRSSGDAGRSIFLTTFQSGGRGVPSPISGAIHWRGLSADGATAITGSTGHFLACSASGSSWSTNLPGSNTIDAKVDALPIAYLLEGAGGAQHGIRGRLPDVWYISAGAPVGSPTPSTGSQERIIAGELLIPCSVALSL